MKHNHILVVGRMHGDDECTYRRYEGMTKQGAVQAFTDEFHAKYEIPQADIDKGYEYTNVYVDFVVMSATPFEVEI